MLLNELLPSILSLSRYDKLQLIRSLAEDLARIEDPSSKSNNGRDDAEIREDERVQAAVHAVDRRNAAGRTEAEAILIDHGTADIAESDQALLSMFGGGRPIPIRFPGESYEAAAALMKLLEAEKSAK
jgi:hypothetical protein